MLVTCTFYGLCHHAATVEFEVERERLAIGAVFAFAGEDYVILSVVAGDGTYAANVDLEQRYRARTSPRPRPLSAGEWAGPPPPQASTAQVRHDAVASELQRLQHVDADALARLGQFLQQFERLQPGMAQSEPSATGATSLGTSGAGEAAGFPELLQALEAQLQGMATQLVQLQAENSQLAGDVQAGRERVAAVEAEVHDLRRRRDATPASSHGVGSPSTPAPEPSEAHTLARLRTRLAQEPAAVGQTPLWPNPAWWERGSRR